MVQFTNPSKSKEIVLISGYYRAQTNIVKIMVILVAMYYFAPPIYDTCRDCGLQKDARGHLKANYNKSPPVLDLRHTCYTE